jgi:hypothetical protein
MGPRQARRSSRRLRDEPATPYGKPGFIGGMGGAMKNESGRVLLAVAFLLTFTATPVFGTAGHEAGILEEVPMERSVPDGGRFFDDDSSVFEADIEAIAAEGVTKGCNPPYQTGFCPGDQVTRGQMAAFLVRAFGYSDDGGGDLFVDDDSSIFNNDIDRLATAGVTKGCNPPTNDRFCPSDFVTRGQMAAFLARALQLHRDDVPDRPQTTNGTNLDLIPTANAIGCSKDHGAVCVMNHNLNGEFFMLTGWVSSDWSSLSASQRADFQSNKVRLEATFDGVAIGIVEWPFEVVDDTGFKTYTFQFPAWLDGAHVLEVAYIDEIAGYRWTIRDNLTVNGGGYPVGNASEGDVARVNDSSMSNRSQPSTDSYLVRGSSIAG